MPDIGPNTLAALLGFFSMITAVYTSYRVVKSSSQPTQVTPPEPPPTSHPTFKKEG